MTQELLPDRERILGPEHPETLAIRNNIAFLTARCGRSVEALRLFQEVLPDRERLLGPNHPDIVWTRQQIQRLSQPDSSDG